MTISISKLSDLKAIFELYDDAMQYQQTVFHKKWEGFDEELIISELTDKRQFKIVINNEIACIFALTFNDAIFWKEKDLQPSIYIHRIVTKSSFRGTKFVPIIIAWAKEYCQQNDKQFIRMDTWGDNPKLINYYVTCGFEHVDTIDLDLTEGLPKHYKGTLALFEIKI